jgi:hypothetical protein
LEGKNRTVVELQARSMLFAVEASDPMAFALSVRLLILAAFAALRPNADTAPQIASIPHSRGKND